MIGMTVVMPVRDVARTLGAQLRALRRQDYRGSWEIVIVDNGSVDDTLAVVAEERAGLPTLRIVDAAGVQGLSSVRNLGAEAALGEKLVFCDGDDVVGPGRLAAMAAELDRHDAVAGAIRLDLLNAPSIRSWREQGLRTDLNIWPGFLSWGIGANLGVRSAAFHAVGGFDEDAPSDVFGEDVEICWRLQLHGYTLGFAPDAVVEYRMRDTWRGTLRQAYRYAVSEAYLYNRFRTFGMPRRTSRAVIAGWLRAPVDLVVARDGGARVRALRVLMKNMGRVRGSLRHRVVYL